VATTGVSLSHLSSDGRTIVSSAMALGAAKYPEYLGACHMINVPWVFQSMWFFIKGLLDEK